MRQHGHRIERATVREKLKPRREPYWTSLGAGRAIGFRKSAVSAGTWIARWTEPARELNTTRPKYRCESLGFAAELPYAEAVQATQTFFEECETDWKGLHRSVAANPTNTVEEACRTYIENMRVEKGDGPADRNASIFKAHVYGKPFGQRPLKELTAFDVQGWRNGLVCPGRKKNTVNRIFRQFAAAMSFIKKRGRLKDDNIWKSVGEFDVEDGRRNRYLADLHRRAILTACDREKDEKELAADEELRYCTPDLGTLFRGLLFTGARPGELAKARVSDFDEMEKVLTLTSNKNQKGKAKVRKFFLYEPAALDFFRNMAGSKLPNAYLITRADGSAWIYEGGKMQGQPRRRDWCSGMRAAIRDANGALQRERLDPIPSGTVAYTARHTVITDLLDGVESEAVQSVVGSSAVMIEKHYDQKKENRLKAKLVPLEKRRSF